MTIGSPAPDETVLAVRGAGVSLGGRAILRDVDFTLGAGEFCGLIGSNGSGKTTLLRTILGFVTPTHGSITIDGGTRHRSIGYVPQRFTPDPHMPMRAWDLVALGLDGQRLGIPLPSRDRRARVDAMLEAVDAGSFAGERFGRLSGGQQQRILIAHALIRRPKLLLLDEPLANLDIRSIAGVVALLRRLSREFRIAVLLSAHDMNPLLPAMDRIVYLAHGRAATGSTEAVVRTEVLSRLYGYHIDVLRVHGRILVVAAEEAAARAPRAGSGPRSLGAMTSAEDLLLFLFEPGLFTSAPVRTAAAVGAAAAIVSGVVGVFTVLRRQSFAGHALADLSSAGGAAAFLLGLSPLLGFATMGVIAAAGMEALHNGRASERDLVTGTVTGAGLGLAALLLDLDAKTSSTTGAAVTVMFGSMFAIPPSLIAPAALLGAGALIAVVLLYRPLLLCSFEPDLAAVCGVPVRAIGLLHLAVVAVAVALSAVTVGAILSTALLIGPAAIALHLARRPGTAILLSAAIGVAATWGGIVVAYDSFVWTGGHGWPVSFCIVGLIVLGYLLASRRAPRNARTASRRPEPA